MEPGPECETFEQFELSVFQRESDDAMINLHSILANGDDDTEPKFTNSRAEFTER